MNLFSLPLAAVFGLLVGCSSTAAHLPASIKIVSPPVGMYLLVSAQPGGGFEMHPGDKDREMMGDSMDVVISPVLTEGSIVLGKSDVMHRVGGYVKNQASCSMKAGYVANIDVVGYEKATCSGNSRLIVQKGETEASSVVFSFAINNK